jgi:hypothetical protein
LCQPWVIVKMIVEKQMECRLAGETELLLGENLPQRHFCPSQNPTWPDPGLNPGRGGGKPGTNRLSYGAALSPTLLSIRIRKSHSSKKKYIDCQYSINEKYSDTITEKSQQSATHQMQEEDWGHSGSLTYHNPQTKEAEAIIVPPQGLWMIPLLKTHTLSKFTYYS